MAGRLVQPASASFIHWLSISGQLCTGSWAREIAKKEPSTSDACGARPPCVVRSQREANKDKDHPATKTENCPRNGAGPFRLGYHHKPGDFRELPIVYYSVAESTQAAGKLNAQRHSRGVALLDSVCIYVRLDFVSLRPDSDSGSP